MKNPGISSSTAWKRLLLLAVGLLAAWWLSSLIREGIKRDTFVAVDLGGKQHIGADFSIATFYLNGTNGFNVGREGGGGSSVCCVLLPTTWRAGLSVDLRWSVADWSKENRAETAAGNSTSITFRTFSAKVPVERYDQPGQVEVHFFAGGKARVLVGWPMPYELRKASVPEDSYAADFATVGRPTADLFTKEELDTMRRRDEERESGFFGGGDWK